MALSLIQIEEALEARGLANEDQRRAVAATITGLENEPETLDQLSALLDKIDTIIQSPNGTIEENLKTEFGDAAATLAVYAETRKVTIELDADGFPNLDPNAPPAPPTMELPQNNYGIQTEEVSDATVQTINNDVNKFADYMRKSEALFNRALNDENVSIVGDPELDRAALEAYFTNVAGGSGFNPQVLADIYLASDKYADRIPELQAAAAEDVVPTEIPVNSFGVETAEVSPETIAWANDPATSEGDFADAVRKADIKFGQAIADDRFTFTGDVDNDRAEFLRFVNADPSLAAYNRDAMVDLYMASDQYALKAEEIRNTPAEEEGLSQPVKDMLERLGVDDPSTLSAATLSRLENVPNPAGTESSLSRAITRMQQQVELTGDEDHDRRALSEYVNRFSRDLDAVAADIIMTTGQNDPTKRPEINLPATPYGVESGELKPETLRWLDAQSNTSGQLNSAIGSGQRFFFNAQRDGVEFTGEREKDAELLANYIRSSRPPNDGHALIADQTADIFTASDRYDKFVEDKNSRDENGRKKTGLHPEEYRQAPEKGGFLGSIIGSAAGGLLGLLVGGSFLGLGGIGSLVVAGIAAAVGWFVGDMVENKMNPSDDSKISGAPNAKDLIERRIDPRERTKMLTWEPQAATVEEVTASVDAAKKKAADAGEDFDINTYVLNEIQRVEARLTPDPNSPSNPAAPAIQREVDMLRTLINTSSAELSPGVITTIGEQYPNYLSALNVEAIGDKVQGVPQDRREWLNPNSATVEQLTDPAIIPVWSLAMLNPDKITEIFTDTENGPKVRARIAEEVEARGIPGDTPEVQLANFFSIRGNTQGASAFTIAMENASDPAKLAEQQTVRNILDKALEAAGTTANLDIDGDGAPDRLSLSDVDAGDRDDIIKVINDLRAEGKLKGELDEQVAALTEALQASGNLERLFDRKNSTITTQQYSSELERQNFFSSGCENPSHLPNHHIVLKRQAYKFLPLQWLQCRVP